MRAAVVHRRPTIRDRPRCEMLCWLPTNAPFTCVDDHATLATAKLVDATIPPSTSQPVLPPFCTERSFLDGKAGVTVICGSGGAWQACWMPSAASTE